MSKKNDPEPLSYDQQLELHGDDIVDQYISPNRRIPAEIVLEPSGNGVRVTARDSEHRVLWGFVGAKETANQIHCLVAVYETLHQLIAEHLETMNLALSTNKVDMQSAKDAIARLNDTVKWLAASLEVKNVTDATEERARIINRIVSDADRQIRLEAASLKGMKPRT
jgi:hypothetical protein